MFLRNLGITIIGILAVSCGGNTSDQNNGDAQDSLATAKEEVKMKEVKAVSIWDKVSVRATPAEDGKWLTSLSLGETLTYLGEEKNDAKDKTYLKVKLNDGTVGWSRTEFVIPESDPGVFLNKTEIYNRPDLLTKSDDSFSKMDIVAVIQTQDDWAEITGQPTGEKWLKSGWVKTSNLTYTDEDIAMAKFAKPYLNADNKEEAAKQLEEILSNQDLTVSVFTADVKEALDAIKFEMENEASVEMDTTGMDE